MLLNNSDYFSQKRDNCL